MELWDILDKDRNITGRTIERGKPIKEGDYHLLVFAIIKHYDGRFLISKRSPDKSFPNMWEVTGGSAIAGENSLMAILREVKEELGLHLQPEKGKLIGTKRFESERSHFSDVWYFEHDVHMDEVICQPEEVSDAMLATKEQLLALVDKDLFIPNDLVINCIKKVIKPL